MTSIARRVIMKTFSIEKVLKSDSTLQSRLGRIQFGGGESEGRPDNVEDGPSGSFRTPMYFIHTQTGSVPHVTQEVLKMIYPVTTLSASTSEASSPIPPVQLSIDSTYKFTKSLEKFDKGLGKFVGLPDVPTFLTIHDPTYPLRRGHNDKFGIALWSRHGRCALTPQNFTDALKSFKVNFSQVISDYDVDPATSGTKRLRKSLLRAEEYLEHVIKDKSSVGGYPQTGIFLTIEAAWFQMDEELARKTVLNLMESRHEIAGVVLTGLTDRFHKGLADTNSNKKKIKSSDSGSRKSGDQDRLRICEGIDLELVSKMVETLPATLPRYIPGPFRLSQMVDLISRGVDIFDSSIASIMADEGEVLLLDELETILPSKSIGGLNGLNTETLPEREGVGSSCNDDTLKEKPSVISLRDKRFFDDFGPLSKYCACYTCRKHTRSYVHHLFTTEELLGPVLIQIHNLTAIDRFFKLMRDIIEESESTETLNEKLKLVKSALMVNTKDSRLDKPVADADLAVVNDVLQIGASASQNRIEEKKSQKL